MLGTTHISISTAESAYPTDSDYYPLIRVFLAPYSEGDCPVDEQLVNDTDTDDESQVYWKVVDEDSDASRAFISELGVFISAESDNEYTVGESYEIRIYQSDVAVNAVK